MNGRTRRKSLRTILTFTVSLVIVLVLYVLSIGPANRAVFEIDNPRLTEVLRVVYWPVLWLHKNTPLRGPIEWYVGLWMPERGRIYYQF